MSEINNEILWLLTELTSDLSAVNDYLALHNLLNQKLRWLFDFDRCTLVVQLSTNAQAPFLMFEINASSSNLAAELISNVQLEKSWQGLVFITKKPYFIDDLQKIATPSDIGTPNTNAVLDSDIDINYSSVGLSQRARSAMLLPLHFGGKIVGSLNFSSNQPNFYASSIRNLGSMFATHLASVVGRLIIATPLTDALSYQNVATKSETAANQVEVAALREDMDLTNIVQSDLLPGLGRDVSLCYQPQVETNSDRKVTGAEALVRWHHPTLGPISPARFIPVTERTGDIVLLGYWILEQACRQRLKLQSDGVPPDFRVCVNVSAVQFMQPDFVETVLSILEKTQLPPHLLELEITESLFIEDLNNVSKKLQALKNRGIAIALDDFGTGYSALSYLHRLPIDVLKIDQSFVRAVTASESEATPSRIIVQSIIALAHQLGLQTVAEGVETAQQFEFLQECKCDRIQGYFISPPIKAHDLESWF